MQLFNSITAFFRQISEITIITHMIIEIHALSLAENGIIFRYNHLRRGDYSGRTNFQKCHSEEYQTRHKVWNDTLQRSCQSKDVKIVLNVTKKPFKFRENFAYVDMHE